MAYTISTTNDNRKKDGSQMQDFAHNLRDERAVASANGYDLVHGRDAHIDTSKSGLNEYWKTESLEDAYERIFGDAVREYNAKQKRSDRKTSIEKEMQKIRDSVSNKNPQYLCYEMIVQVGDRDNHPDDEICKTILKEFYERWEERYPNLPIFQASLHLDEATPHLHVDYIPIAKENKRGLSVQNGLRRAYEEMGFTNQNIMSKDEKGKDIDTGVLDRENGAKTKWIADCNQMLEDICIEHGLEIEHPMRGEKVKRLDVPEYKAMKEELEQKTKELEQKEKEIKAMKSENVQAQRQNLKLINENQLLISENTALSAQLEEKQEELRKANDTLEILDTTCASLHEEIVGLKRDIAHIIEENKVPDDVVQDISNGIQDAVMDAFDNGRRAGQEGYERERLIAFKSDSVCKALRPLDKPLEKFRSYADNLRLKIRDAIDMHNRNANRARQLALGNIDVYTGYDGRVSEAGKAYIERYVRGRLDAYDQDEVWEPLRMQYRGLVTDEKKDRYVNRMVKDVVDFAEDSCAEKPVTTKYVPKSKFEKMVDRCISGNSIGHGALAAIRTIQQIQEEQLEEYER